MAEKTKEQLQAEAEQQRIYKPLPKNCNRHKKSLRQSRMTKNSRRKLKVLAKP